MSQGSTRIHSLLKEIFPTYRVKTEKYVMYSNTELFFDFYLPELKILIEVQGDQHHSFTKFFHQDINKFRKHQYRDTLKTQWADEQGLNLITINYKESLTISGSELKKLIIRGK